MAIAVVAAGFLTAATTPAQSPAPASTLAGTWEGQMLLAGNWRFMEADFGLAGTPGETKVDLPQERREFRNYVRDGSRLQWTLTRGRASIRFEGLLDGDVIRGRTEQNGVPGEFQMLRVDRRAPPEVNRLAGTYRTGDGQEVTLARFGFGDDIDRLAILDVQRGYWGTLLPTAPNRYVLAPARSGRFPTTIRLDFASPSSGGGGQWTMTGAGRAPITARRVEVYETEEIAARNGDVTLAGTVIRPLTRGPHPAIVMVHSSGNQSRNGPIAYFRLIANLFAARGIAAVVYDKRGVGDSTGSWPTASFDDLSGDLRAVVEATRRLPGIDAGRVGLWSLSQGGWVAPLAAAGDRRIAFMALVSAAATTPAQQEIDRVALVMKANGSTPEEIAAAGRYLATFFDVVARRQPFAALQTAMADTAAARWTQYVPRPRTEPETGWSPAPATLDPGPILRALTMPILAIHGSEDLDVPASTNSPLFAKFSTHPASRQQVLAGADHYMLLGVANPDTEYRRLSPAYLTLLTGWTAGAARPSR